MTKINREYYVLSKQIYFSKAGKRSCKIIFFDPNHYVEGSNEKQFKGLVTREEYCHLDYYHKVGVGYHNFVFSIPEFGHDLKLVDILPIVDKAC